MIAKGPAVPTAAATAILGLVIGGVIGFYGRAAQEKPGNTGGGQTPAAGAPGGAMGGGRGGGGGGASQPNPSRDLTGLVRNIETVERVQNKGLTPAQKKTVLPILLKLKAADHLTDDDCKAQLASIDSALTSDQKDLLKTLTPQRGGGRGGAPGAAGMMAQAGPPPAGGMTYRQAPASGGGMASMGGGGGAGAGSADPTKPFANERNKKSLDDLIAALQK